MTTSDSVNEIAAALAKAQGVMKNASLNKVNPHFRSKYADLAGIRDTVIPALTAQGIAAVQTLDCTAEGHTYVLTRLLHTSGQWIESLCPIPNAPDMQKMGSAITYARRYSLSAICGIAADEDDDAEAAVDRTPAKAAVAAKPKGYEQWVKVLDAFAAKHTDGQLISEIAESGTDECKAYLRTDATTLAALRSKAAKNKTVAA